MTDAVARRVSFSQIICFHWATKSRKRRKKNKKRKIEKTRANGERGRKGKESERGDLSFESEIGRRNLRPISMPDLGNSSHCT